MIIGVILGLLLGIVGTSVPWLFPFIFTPDRMVTQEVSSFFFQNLVYISVLAPLSFLILCNLFENVWQYYQSFEAKLLSSRVLFCPLRAL